MEDYLQQAHSKIYNVNKANFLKSLDEYKMMRRWLPGELAMCSEG
jgi:hypothetical protein